MTVSNDLLYAHLSLASALHYLRAVPEADPRVDQVDRITTELEELDRDLQQLSGWRETPA